MRKTLIASSAIIGALSIPAIATASPLTYNLGAVSNYVFRGITQTHGGPAVQGGIDYAHASGFYLGTWASNVSWVKNWLGKGRVEVDLYGGFRQTVGDFGYDIGTIGYFYPGHGEASPHNLANPNTQEVYVSGSYRWLSAKYSYTTSQHFIGWYGGQNFDKSTRGSDYLELNANYDLGGGWALIGHAGHQRIKNLSIANYTDYKVGITKDVGLGIIGLSYTTTSASGNCAPAEIYCWGTGGSSTAAPTGDFRNVSGDWAFLSFQKNF